jgi:hypothetical protein
MHNNNSGHVLAAVLGSLIAGLFLLAGILLAHYLSSSNQVTTNNYGNSGQTNSNGNQPPSNTQTFQCPDTGQVSGWTGANVNKTAENCAFTVDGHGSQLTGVTCTT